MGALADELSAWFAGRRPGRLSYGAEWVVLGNGEDIESRPDEQPYRKKGR